MAPAVPCRSVPLATSALRSQLYGVTATDPATLALVSVLAVALAVAASYLPSRRGAHRPTASSQGRLIDVIDVNDVTDDVTTWRHDHMTTLGGTPTLIGLRYDASSSYQRGAADAPPAIREALWSPSANSWTELGVDIGAESAITDAGDLDLRTCASADARLAIEHALTRLLAIGARPVSLGGDHSITYPVLRAVRPHAPRLTILHVDAHPDLYDEFEGDRYSHACPFARIMEEGLADRLVQVGVRAFNGHQRAQALRYGVEVTEMRHLPNDPSALRIGSDAPLYVSIDLDALDPAFAPGVSHREPGGLSVRQLLGLLQSLEAPIVAADIVELNPGNDPSGISATACAKILRELLGVMLARKPDGS